MKLYILLLVALAALHDVTTQDVDANAEPINCPSQCECEDNDETNVYTVTCSEITDLTELGEVKL